MSESVDMSQPVTRGELREELAKYPTREEVDRKFDLMLGAIMDRFDRFRTEMRAEMATMGTALRNELGADLARHARAIEENIITRMTAMQKPYLDLPRRVARLEAKVFPPRPARGKRR